MTHTGLGFGGEGWGVMVMMISALVEDGVAQHDDDEVGHHNANPNTRQPATDQSCPLTIMMKSVTTTQTPNTTSDSPVPKIVAYNKMGNSF